MYTKKVTHVQATILLPYAYCKAGDQCTHNLQSMSAPISMQLVSTYMVIAMSSRSVSFSINLYSGNGRKC